MHTHTCVHAHTHLYLNKNNKRPVHCLFERDSGTGKDGGGLGVSMVTFHATLTIAQAVRNDQTFEVSQMAANMSDVS